MFWYLVLLVPLVLHHFDGGRERAGSALCCCYFQHASFLSHLRTRYNETAKMIEKLKVIPGCIKRLCYGRGVPLSHIDTG